MGALAARELRLFEPGAGELGVAEGAAVEHPAIEDQVGQVGVVQLAADQGHGRAGRGQGQQGGAVEGLGGDFGHRTVLALSGIGVKGPVAPSFFKI